MMQGVLAAAFALATVPVSAPPPAMSTRRFADAGGQQTVVLLGGTEMARERAHGWLETLLTAARAGRPPRFRNMAWEGDTVHEQPRPMRFGSWRDQLGAVGATVVIARFGQMEALDGPARLPEFVAAYGKLLDQLGARRVVLLSPTPFERPASPALPDHSGRNQEVRLRVEAIRELARKRGARFVDLFTPLLAHSGAPLTMNGVHLSPDGQREAARIVVEQLGLAIPSGLALEALRAAIVEKNRLWFDCWRPMNWAFAYGDRVQVPFGQPAAVGLALPDELAVFKALIDRADRRIWRLARLP